MIIIGEWHVRLFAIIAYKYGQRDGATLSHLEVVLVSGHSISGFVEMDIINRILQHMESDYGKRG